MVNPVKKIDEQFFADRMTVNPETGCHEWQRYISQNGYGTVKHKRKQWPAHRFMWAHKNGPIPDGMVVCHKCDNRRCINPDHLFLGTTQDNVDDKMSKGRFKPLAGEKNGSSKLTHKDVLNILNDTRSQRAIAADYGVGQSNVSLIKQRKAWTGVTL